MKSTTKFSTILAISLAFTSLTASSDVVLVDDFTNQEQVATHRIGGSVSETPTIKDGFVYSSSVNVTSGTQLPNLVRMVAARQSGDTWNNYSRYAVNINNKFYDTTDIGAVNMSVDAVSLGYYGDLLLSENFTPVDVTAASYVEVVTYGTCLKDNNITVEANNGSKVVVKVTSHKAGLNQSIKIPVSSFNQPGFPVLTSLSSLKLSSRAIGSTRFSILKINIGGVTVPKICATRSVIANGIILNIPAM
jgi:hypothetical protein